jgi:hypothetical protein
MCAYHGLQQQRETYREYVTANPFHRIAVQYLVSLGAVVPARCRLSMAPLPCITAAALR